jgi:RNA polymerase sigma-70 factor (ECF subfamily)
VPDPAEFAAVRLDQIQTRWSVLRRAHASATLSGDSARHFLVVRYGPAVRTYVGAILRNPHDADELAQDVVLRLLRGDFARADPDRGRFRDLLKTAIRNMVRNHADKAGRRQGVDYDLTQAAQPANEDADPAWDEAWRANLLDLAMAGLQEYEQTHPGSVTYSVLKLRTDFPDAPVEDLAARLAGKTGKPVRADAFRQQLRRARVRFAEHLIREVADGLDDPAPARVQDELAALGLLEMIRDFLPPGWGKPTG